MSNKWKYVKSKMLLKGAVFDFKYRYARPVISLALSLASYPASIFGLSRLAIDMAMKAHRMSDIRIAFNFIARNLPELDARLDEFVSRGVDIKEASIRSIIVKFPERVEGGIDKGVLIITFTKVSSYYYWSVDLAALTKYFHIVLEPSWSGYMDPDILFWALRCDQITVVQASDERDRRIMQDFSPKFFPVTFGASDWVDVRIFNPGANAEKKWDSIYVANTKTSKRVHCYMMAVRDVVDSGCPTYRGLLVCAAWGGQKEEVIRMRGVFGLNGNLDLMFDLRQEELCQAIRQSKVNVLMSYKEGSNRSLFESMFCDTPALLLRRNTGVNRAYFNEFTGLVIDEKSLAMALIFMSLSWERFAPRQWCNENISPEVTMKKLERVIAKIPKVAAGEGGGKYFTKVNNPEVSYFEHPNVTSAEISGPLLRYFDKNNSVLFDEDKLFVLIEDLKVRFRADNATAIAKRPFE